MDVRRSCMDVNRRIVPLAFGLLSLIPSALADVAPGELFWIQGYDGNPAQPGFAVEGTLRISSIDDSQLAGINLSSGAITNAPDGLIEIQLGAGGGRFFNGSLINRGTLEATCGFWMGRPTSLVENSGTFTIAEGHTFFVHSPGMTFRQRAGSFTAPTFDFREGTFVYSGGTIAGNFQFRGSALVVDPAVSAGFDITFRGPNCRYEGLTATNRTLRLVPEAADESSLELRGIDTLSGRLVLSSAGEFIPTLQTGGRLRIAPSGHLDVAFGGGGWRRINGDLRNDGRWTLTTGALIANASGPVTNTALVEVTFPGLINSGRGYVQTGGETRMVSGHISVPGSSVVLKGGRLTGSGTIGGSLENEAELDLPQSAGGFRVEGSMVLRRPGVLKASFAVPSASQALINVPTSTATLGGTLEIGALPGFGPRAGQEFVVLRAQRLAGWFDDIRLPALPAGLFWQVRRTATDVSLAIHDSAMEVQSDLTQLTTTGALEVTGPLAAGISVEESSDLRTWRTVVTQRPFLAWLSLTNLPTGSGSGALGFFRVRLLDGSSPE
jgi:hypothetical protein